MTGSGGAFRRFVLSAGVKTAIFKTSIGAAWFTKIRQAEKDARNHSGLRMAARLAIPDRRASIANVGGDVQAAQGDVAGALKSYRDSFAIFDRLTQFDPNNAGWQRDLSLSYVKVGNVRVARGDVAGALKSYRDSLAIRERMAQSDPRNTDWQYLLSVSYERIGGVQVAQGDLAGALKSYRDSLAIAISERLAQSDPGSTTATQ
jgi:tetratricopeptide (TPR) repeat protein